MTESSSCPTSGAFFGVRSNFWSGSNASESDCVENPFSCDVVGAFLNGLCVGWVYADSNGETTVPVMGYDDSNATSSQQTQGYCTTSDTPIFLVFDSSEQSTYLLDIGEDFGGHRKLTQLRTLLDESTYQSYKKMSVIRNPFDRIVSLYKATEPQMIQLAKDEQNDIVITDIENNNNIIKFIIPLKH